MKHELGKAQTSNPTTFSTKRYDGGRNNCGTSSRILRNDDARASLEPFWSPDTKNVTKGLQLIWPQEEERKAKWGNTVAGLGTTVIKRMGECNSSPCRVYG